MAKIVATNIISPLGFTSEENLLAVISGKTELQVFSGKWDLPEMFVASLFTDEQWEDIKIDGYTRFESLVIKSVSGCILKEKKKTIFILSTTKGDIGVTPAETASHIADYLGIETKPIVVCNACISGLAAIILAERLLESGKYERAIICGADIQTDFIVSGFQSLKAISHSKCKPFDINRTGLNLGEAASTIILENSDQTESLNDDGIGFINAHGTATMFNDQMESVALERADLCNIPVNCYKGIFGHTLGAAGVLESVISLKSADKGIILGAYGFEEMGVSGHIQICAAPQESKTNSFLKIISGFGGCNAALRFFKLQDNEWHTSNGSIRNDAFHITNPSRNGEGCWEAVCGSISGKHFGIKARTEFRVKDSIIISSEKDNLLDIYKDQIKDYPKFWKMDSLSKLGFIASEMLLQRETDRTRFEECSDRAVVLFNHSSSLFTDNEYKSTIADRNNYYPSPSVFIYTLPNVVSGEIAIRNKYHGETSFYIIGERDEKLMDEILLSTFMDEGIKSILTGWIDYTNDENFVANFKIIESANI